MTGASSKIFIIDASIARAAGPETSLHPTSKNCRDFLNEIRTVCHKMAWSPAIRAEWNEHRSGYAMNWLTSMYARKKIVLIEQKEDAKLRKNLNAAAKSDRDRAAMLKDVPLLEAAIQTDQRIASLDDTVRKLFNSATSQHPALKKIIWVNPDRTNEATIEWLQTGAPSEPRRQLAVRGGS